jgi:ribonuclease H2 subunit A
VYAIAFWPSSENESISKLAFNDSKQLKETERESLLKQLQENGKIGWAIEPISAQSISEEMLRASPVSLNAMSYEAVIRGLKAIAAAGPKVGDVFVDTVGDPDYYKSRLISALGNDFAASFTIEKKADSKFKVVSAASIVAKVTRDRLIRVWKWHEPGLNLDKNFGSGYPSDEVCVEW